MNIKYYYHVVQHIFLRMEKQEGKVRFYDGLCGYPINPTAINSKNKQ